MLSIYDLTVAYFTEENPEPALDSVSLEIPAGGYTLGVVGESGSGKTTLGMSILDLIEPPGRIISGKVEFNGKDVLAMRDGIRKYRWEDISMVFQSAMNSLNPVKRVSDHIIEVIEEHSNASKSEARSRAIQLLSDVGIPPERANDFPHELSGGMKQRVVIAMALALSPKLLIADEPTSALDVVVQRQVLSMLREQVTKRGLSLMFITHELAILGGLVENIAVMYRGEIVEKGPIDEILNHPLHPYTEMLMDSLLSLDKEGTMVSTQSRGFDGANLVRGTFCKYVTRCKYAFERCRQERPILTKVQREVWVACHKFS